MSFTMNEQTDSFVASGDLSGLKNRIVDIVGAFKIGHSLAAGGYGVLLDAPKSGEHGAVVIGGQTQVFVGAAVSAGDAITSAASGWGVKVTSGNGQYVLGRALTAAASGMLCPIRLQPYYRPNSVGN